MGELKQTIEAQKQIDRLHAREASRLASEQQKARVQIEEFKPKLQNVVVYDWAIQRVVGWMETVESGLDQRRIDEHLLHTAGRIERELHTLISAILQTQALPMPTEFVEQDTGSGAGGGGAAGKSVPTLTELLVLRAMQEEVNRRTQELGKDFVPETALEATLRQLESVGEDQEQVRHLTELVVNRTENRP